MVRVMVRVTVGIRVRVMVRSNWCRAGESAPPHHPKPLKGERLDTFCARYAGTFVFVIAEISMVGADVFAKIGWH